MGRTALNFCTISEGMPQDTVSFTIGLCEEYPEIPNVLCGAESAYCQRGRVSPEFFNLTQIYYHRLKWVDNAQCGRRRADLSSLYTGADERRA